MTVYRAERPDRPLTIEAFERLPEEDAYRVELVRGVLVREPRPAAEHGRILFDLCVLLSRHVRGRGLGHGFADVGVILSRSPATVRGPDLAFVAAARLPAGPPRQGFLDIPPDLCVEIASPSNASAELDGKAREYLEAGVRLVWVVDPGTRTVTEYGAGREPRVIGADEALDGGDVVPGFRVPVAELFAP